MAERNESYFSRIIESFEKNPDAEYELYSPMEMKQRFPMLNMGDKVWGCFDPAAGIIMSDKALKLIWNNYSQSGGTIRDNCRMKQIVPLNNPQRVRIELENGENIVAKSVVVCAGPWTSKVMDPLGWKLPLKPMKVTLFYYKSNGHLPHNFYYSDDTGLKVWGLAQYEYSGLNKVCLSYGPEVDPDDRDAVDIGHERQTLHQFIAEKFLKVEPNPSIEESCIYTASPDLVHILDRHPKYPNIVVGCGFSGSGFKMGPVTGEILADMVTGKPSKYNIDHFKASRFRQTSSL